MRFPYHLLARRALAVLAIGAVVLAIPALRTDDAAPPSDSDPHAWHVAPDSAAARSIRIQQVAALRGSEFRADCLGTHTAADDPIVRFNQPGASHLHQFIGNYSANATSTQETLRVGATNCNPAVDRSPYWVPALFKNGVHVPPESVIIYYQGLTNPTTAVAFPPGLKIVVGNALATREEDNPSARWNCTGASASDGDFMNCPPGSKLQTYLDFPTCWNGRDLDSADHFSHMAWSLGGIDAPCPSSHPVAVPRVQFVITYNVNGTGLTLAGTRNGVNVTNAPGYTFHGDFWNVWDQAELERRVRGCINAGYICGNDGCPIGGTNCSGNPPPTPTPTGGNPPGGRDAYGTIQAESFDAQSGLSVQPTSDSGGGENIGYVSAGDWALYRGVNFGTTAATQFRARVASGASAGVSGLVQVRLGSPTATPVGAFAVGNTGGWQSWQTIPTNMSGVTGTHDVYLTFASGQPGDFVNVNWFAFGR